MERFLRTPVHEKTRAEWETLTLADAMKTHNTEHAPLYLPLAGACEGRAGGCLRAVAPGRETPSTC